MQEKEEEEAICYPQSKKTIQKYCNGCATLKESLFKRYSQPQSFLDQGYKGIGWSEDQL
jgi:hypothetical protein